MTFAPKPVHTIRLITRHIPSALFQNGEISDHLWKVMDLLILWQSKSFHVGIVGAGIGGLAAAIALQRAGAKVTVLESAAELGEVSVHF